MPVALFLLAIGVLLIRQVAVGRALHLAEDTRDAVTAITRGDFDSLDDIGKRRGDDGKGTAPAPSGTPEASEASSSGASVLEAARRRGSAAKGYVWGATGPDYYDCSGLVWRAVRDTGVYSGPRFTTATAPFVFPKFAHKVSTPAVGDIALWTGRHMGIVSAPGKIYGAQSVKTGIRERAIDGNPTYWRIGR